MSSQQWYEIEYIGPLSVQQLVTPKACVVCHGPSTETVKISASRSENNVSSSFATTVNTCEKCANRERFARSAAFLIALAAAATGWGVLWLVGYLFLGPDFREQSLTSQLLGVSCYGCFIVILPSLGLGIWLYDKASIVQRVARLKPGVVDCSLMFRHKAMALAVVLLNIDRVEREAGEDSAMAESMRRRLKDWSEDQGARDLAARLIAGGLPQE